MLPRRNRVRVRVWVWVWVWLRLKLSVWVANVNVRGLEGKMGRELLVLKLLLLLVVLVVWVVGGWELWVVVEGKMVFWRRVRWLWLRWCLWVRAEEEVDLVSYEASFVGEV
jgi:hypothetical protein